MHSVHFRCSSHHRQISVSVVVLALIVAVMPSAWSMDGVRVGDCWTDYNGVNHCGGGSPDPGPINGGYPDPEPRPVIPKKTPQELRSERAQNIYGRGYHLYQLGNYRAAEGYIAQALKVDPDAENIREGYCAVKIAIGNQYFDQKNYTKAIAYYQSGQGICPANGSFQQNIDAAQTNMQWVNQRAQYDTAHQNFKTQQKTAIDRINSLVDNFTASHRDPVNTLEFASLTASLQISPGSQHAVPVDVRDLPDNSGKQIIEPSSQKKGFKMKDVPLPPDIVAYYKKHDPFGGGPNGPTKTTDLILSALQAGNGSLEDSLLWLTKKVREQGDNQHGLVALSYMEGLRYGAIGFPKSGPTDEQSVYKIISNNAQDIPDWFAESYLQMVDHDGDGWQDERARLIQEAIDHGKGDLYASLKYLENGRLKNTLPPKNAVRDRDPVLDAMEDTTGWSAYYYILGFSVYPGLKT